MKIVCDACGAKYSIADEKVKGKGFKIRCKKCSHVIVKTAEETGASPSTVMAAQAPGTQVFDYNGPAPGEDAVWHAVIDQEQVGPITAAEVRAKIEAGQLDADSYVWRDGFDDWQPLSAVPDFAELVASGQTTRSDYASVSSGAGSAQHDDVAGDLFGARGAAKASIPPGSSGGDGRLRNERNENSVLFSLSNLAALASDSKPASSASSSAAASTAGKAQLGGSEGSGLIDIRSMAAAYMAEKPAKKVGGGVGSVDDIPVFSSVAFAEPAVMLPPTRRASNNKVLYALIAAVGVLAIAAVAMVFVMTKDKDNAAAVAQAPAAPANTPPAGGGGPDKAPVAVPGDTGSPTPAADAGATVAAAGDKVAATTGTAPEEPKARDRDKDKPRDRDRDKDSTKVAVKDSPKETPKDPAPAKEPASTKGCGEVDCLLAENPPACCAKYRKTGSSGGGSSTSSSAADESLDKAAIQSGMAKVAGRVKSCGSRSSAKGRVKVKVKVTPDGSVSSVSVVESPDDALGSCVASAVEKASFKKTSEGGSFTVPYTF